MKIDLISPGSSSHFGGVERYAANLLSEYSRLTSSDTYRLVNFPDALAQHAPFEKLQFGFGFRDIAAQFFSHNLLRLARDGIEYLATSGVPFHERGYLIEFRRQAGLSLGLGGSTGETIVHGLSHFVPRFARTSRKVVTVHDVGPMRMPDRYPLRYVTYMHSEFARQLDVCDKVIVDSPFTKEEVVRWYGTSRAKIAVVPLGVERAFRRVEDRSALKRYGLRGPYVYYPVGTMEPRKNLPGTIHAIQQVRDRTGIPYVLALTGRKLAYYPEIDSEIKEGCSRGLVTDLGFIPEADLPALYSGAELTVYPSLYEGFGLPVLESMACGTPVVISNIEPLTYVAGGAAYASRDPSSDSLAEAIEQVATDTVLRQELVDAGARRVKKFQWEATALGTRAVYRELS